MRTRNLTIVIQDSEVKLAIYWDCYLIPYCYDFVRDSLFNEYTYVIDFDNNNLEIYKGLNNKSLENKPEEHFYKEHLTKIVYYINFLNI